MENIQYRYDDQRLGFHIPVFIVIYFCDKHFTPVMIMERGNNHPGIRVI